MEEHPRAARIGLTLGFYRTFAVPEIAAALHATGKATARPMVRAKATGTLMYALFEHGPDHPEGRAALARIDRIHASTVPASVGNDLYLYVLAVLCVTPVRWIDAHCRTPTSERQKAAAHAFHTGLATRLEITGVPPGFHELAHWADDFERRTFRPTGHSASLITATRDILARRFPGVPRPLVRAVMDALLDRRLREGLGLPEPALPLRVLVAAVLRLGRSLQARRPRPMLSRG